MSVGAVAVVLVVVLLVAPVLFVVDDEAAEGEPVELESSTLSPNEVRMYLDSLALLASGGDSAALPAAFISSDADDDGSASFDEGTRASVSGGEGATGEPVGAGSSRRCS